MELELCWNAFGEVDNLKEGLGTAVPAQKNPDVLSLQGNVRFSRETIGYVPLRESKIVAPSEMFIVGDHPGFLWRSEELVKVALAVVRSTSTFCLVVMGRRRTSRSWICGIFPGGAYLVANKRGVPPLESNQRVDQKRFNANLYRC